MVYIEDTTDDSNAEMPDIRPSKRRGQHVQESKAHHSKTKAPKEHSQKSGMMRWFIFGSITAIFVALLAIIIGWTMLGQFISSL